MKKKRQFLPRYYFLLAFLALTLSALACNLISVGENAPVEEAIPSESDEVTEDTQDDPCKGLRNDLSLESIHVNSEGRLEFDIKNINQAEYKDGADFVCSIKLTPINGEKMVENVEYLQFQLELASGEMQSYSTDIELNTNLNRYEVDCYMNYKVPVNPSGGCTYLPSGNSQLVVSIP